MQINKDLLNGYENMRIVNYKDIAVDGVNTVRYADLSRIDRPGVLKANQYINGVLTQTYTDQENHVGVIAATRLGKTTSYVIPTVLSFANQLKKRSMIISDPKGEIYRYTAQTLKEKGYKVKLLNFRNYLNSECWNMLTPIFRKYRSIGKVEEEVGIVSVGNKMKNIFRGKIYDRQNELDRDIETVKEMRKEEVSNDIDDVARMLIITEDKSDPYWEDSARDLLKAFLWAMLEDSSEEKGKEAITEDTYSFSTIFRIVATFKDGNSTIYDDRGYFSDRSTDSQAYIFAKNTLLENGTTTRKCVMGTFITKLSVLRESTMRLITSCNSFEISELAEGPIALFIDYRDELKAHYKIISLFVKDAYRFLIETANGKVNGKLDVPFYFLLDEFGNFPALKDFETTISACAGRNIFFILIIQSYAQLNCVYGNDVAEIIKDNLNVHIFFGSNNPSTLEAFSRECGQITRISPLSALNGKGPEIETFQIETVPLVPKSRLAHFEPGECIVTEANCGYVMFSKLERYYLCEEFKNLKQSSEKEYKCPVDPLERRYIYKVKRNNGRI